MLGMGYRILNDQIRKRDVSDGGFGGNIRLLIFRPTPQASWTPLNFLSLRPKPI